MASNYHLGYKTNTVKTKVITPDGNPGWINVYSASNENPV